MTKSSNKGVINLFGKGSGSKDSVKYSQLLERLMEPFENEFPEEFYKDDAIYLAISAWNFACLKKLIPPEEFTNIMAMAPDQEGTENKLLKKMIDRKSEKFGTYERFIADFEFEESDGEKVFTVVTQGREDYLREMMEQAEEEMDGDDYDEGYVDRSAIMILPKAPFFNWHGALYPNEPVQNEKNPTTYLIGYMEGNAEMEQWLTKKFDYIFKSELDAWHSDAKDWPKKRTYALFKEWFQVIPCTEVYDTELWPLHKGR